ncbi:MAG: LacI family DNA-binding transcriptional regulator [Kiritimatiellae bacterium]|nr:LacI family DNA-binding transcriptional regulator [Kiritimatiellia bacterium]
MPTMEGIAKRVGVSRATVSVILNGRADSVGIAAATRQRVLAVARELGYQANQLARAVATGRTKVIGFVGASIRNEWTARMEDGVLDVAQQSGYLVKAMKTRDSETEAAMIDAAIQQRLAGVIAVAFDEAALMKAHAVLSRHGMPLATIDHTLLNLGRRRAPRIRVFSDDETGMALAVRHLVVLGHRRITMVMKGVHSTSWVLRGKGYRDSLRDAGLPMRAIEDESDLQDAGGRNQLGRKLFGLTDRPTAVICPTDVIAMGVLRIARAAGLRVPEDVSIIGFGGLDTGLYADPALTTVALPFDRMGERAAELLIAAIEGKGRATGVEERLPAELIVRESTGPAPPSNEMVKRPSLRSSGM